MAWTKADLRRLVAQLDRRILLAFLALAVCLFLFSRLASEVAEGETFALDRWLMLALRTSDPANPVGPGWLEYAMVQFTALGSGPVLWLLTALAAGYLLAARKPKSAAFVAASISVGMMLNVVLKDIFVRPRPELVAHMVEVQSTSFPSGHAMNSAIVYLTLGVLLAQSQQRRSIRIFIVSAAIALAMLVGVSRVYLGVHWPSDVLAGWSVGASWALGCSLLARRVRRISSEGPSKQIDN